MYKEISSKPEDSKLNKTSDELRDKDKQKSLLYNKKVTCPVCSSSFNARAVKKSSYRIVKRDSDFFIRYSVINPYFYDVWVCDNCGYAAIKSDFLHLNEHDADIIKNKISPKWKSKNYPKIYDIELAIQRYKLSLLNYYVIEAKASQKAINFLKIAWMYRLKGDNENEMKSLKQALDNFNTAYYNESLPICGMDRFTTIYLIGELMRRIGREEDSLIWFSQVLTSTSASQKIKNMATDQKELVKNSLKNKPSAENQPQDTLKENKNHGFFSKFLK